jgi:hypothetical protein
MRSLLLLLPLALAAQNYDIVMSGGRVIDPESGLDAVRGIPRCAITRDAGDGIPGEVVGGIGCVRGDSKEHDRYRFSSRD